MISRMVGIMVGNWVDFRDGFKISKFFLLLVSLMVGFWVVWLICWLVGWLAEWLVRWMGIGRYSRLVG